MTELHKYKIAVIGAGNVGFALAHQFNFVNHDVALGTRQPEETKKEWNHLLGTLPPTLQVSLPLEAVENAEICIICVNDQSIADVAKALAPHLETNCVVTHCSGALDSLALEEAHKQGHQVCSSHPLNTFPDKPSALKLLSNAQHATPLYCEGDRAALDRVIDLFSTIGFNPLEIRREAKPLYHAASVIACNYLSTLMDLSLQCADAADLKREPFWEALQPLIQNTLSNIGQIGPEAALSGPIARGDSETLSKHMQSLREVSPSLATQYQQLGKATIALAQRSGSLNDEFVSQLLAALE